MGKNLAILGLAVVAAFALGGLWLADRTVVQVPVGAQSGPEHHGDEVFYAGLQASRLRFGLSSTTLTNITTTSTLTAAQFCSVAWVNASPGVGSATLRLASSTNLINECIPQLGDRHTVRFDNSSGSASDLEIAVGDASTTLLVHGNPSGTYNTEAALRQTEWADVTITNLGGESRVQMQVTELR